jgi:hypothetical protein
MMTRIGPKNSSSTQRHFTEHLVGVFRKPPRKTN